MPDSSHAVAHTWRCGRCDGSFGITELGTSVTCPYCGHRQALARHRELRTYQDAVRRRVAAADEQHMVAASLEAWTASAASNPARNLGVAYGMIIGLPVLVAAVLFGLHAAGVLSQRGPGMSLAIGGASYLGVVGYLVWQYANRARKRTRATRLEQARVACPTCGAPGLLTPGAAADSCEYCNAALVPTETLMVRGIDAAKAAHWRAARDRRRAQRAAVVRATNLGPFTLIMPIMIIGSFVLMIGGTAVGYSVQMLRGEEPFHPAIFALWAMTIAIIGGVGVYLSRQRQQRRRLEGALGDVARQLGGQVLPTVQQRAAWLDAHWSADYDQQHLVNTTNLTCSASASVGAYSALIDVELNAGRPAPRIDIYLTAWVPEVSDERAPSERVRDKVLSGLGFHVRSSASGLIARANKELLDAARQDPDVVHVVVPALTRLAHLAAERDCSPIA